MKILKKAIIILVLSKANLAICQDVKIELKSRLTVEKVWSIQMFKIDRKKHECADQKAASIVSDGKVSGCFRKLKSFGRNDSKKIMNLLLARDSYQMEKYDCFTTEYAILLFDRNNVIVGCVNFSFVCNRDYSLPIINPLNRAHGTDLSLVGFSRKGRKGILKVLGLSNYRFE